MPEWYEKQMRIIHPSLGRTPGQLENVDLSRLADDVANAGYNVQHLEYSLVWDGEQKQFLFQTDKADQVARDVLGEYLPEAHRRGIKVFIYMNVHWAGVRFITEHPDWVQRKVDGSPLTGLYGGLGTSCCVNSPWRDWIFELIEEMSVQHEIDGIFYDGPCVYSGACYCASCQHKFQERYGLDILSITDKDGPHWPEFIQFRYDSIADFCRDGSAVLKKHRPGAPLYMNANGLHSGAGAGRDNRTLIPHQDILGAEGGFMFYGRPMDVPLWKVSATAKFLEAQAEGKPTVIFTAVGHKPWEYPLTAPEIRLNTAATFACGAYPWLGGYHETIHDPSMRAVSDELAFFARYADELAGTVARSDTALMWSNVTADFYGTHLPEIDFMIEKPEAAREYDFQSSFYGGYEALMRSGTPFQVVDEVGIEKGELAAFKNLLIADAACMSEKTADAIRSFVEKGGHIVVTGHSSLYDERGRPRDDFLLSDVLGASYAGPRGLSDWDAIWLDAAFRKKYEIDRPDIPSPRYQVKVRALEGAHIVSRYYEPTESRYSRKPNLAEDPAAIATRYGNGTCLYLAGNWAKSYWVYRIDAYFNILSSLVRFDPLVSLEAPSSSIEVVLRSHPTSGDWYIHLLNYTGEMERPIKRIVPIADVVVRLRAETDPMQVDALRADARLDTHRDGVHVVVRLDRLLHHEVIRIRW